MFNVILNHQPTKAACAAIGRSNVVRRALPLEQNGFVLTGYDDQAPDPAFPYLVVFDFDVVSNQDALTSSGVIDFVSFEVETGSNGCHIYIWTDHPVHNSQKKPLSMRAKQAGLKGFDVRGEGGIIFAPGCSFTDHNHSYSIQANAPIIERKASWVYQFIRKMIWEPTDAYKRMREGFRNIMNGDWNLAHDMNKETGIDEWLYWSAFWREYLNCGGTMEEGVAHFNNTGLQSTFDEAETIMQLNTAFFQKLGDKRPSNDFYFRLFPAMEDGLKHVATHTNVDAVITKLMERVGQLEEEMDTVLYYFEGGKKKGGKRARIPLR